MNDKENEIFLFETFYVFYTTSQWLVDRPFQPIMVTRKPGVGRFWLRQELNKSHSLCVRPVLTCLKLSICIFWAQILHDDLMMTS